MVQGVKDKEVIAAELAAAQTSLSATPRGAALMRKSANPCSCPYLLAAPPRMPALKEWCPTDLEKGI